MGTDSKYDSEMKSDDPWFYDHFQLMIEQDCLGLHIINDRVTYDRITYDRAINNENDLILKFGKGSYRRRKRKAVKILGIYQLVTTEKYKPLRSSSKG